MRNAREQSTYAALGKTTLGGLNVVGLPGRTGTEKIVGTVVVLVELPETAGLLELSLIYLIRFAGEVSTTDWFVDAVEFVLGLITIVGGFPGTKEAFDGLLPSFAPGCEMPLEAATITDFLSFLFTDLNDFYRNRRVHELTFYLDFPALAYSDHRHELAQNRTASSSHSPHPVCQSVPFPSLSSSCPVF